MTRIVAGEWLAHDGLNQDALEAFCLNLRLLIQDRDEFSIRQISEISKSWPAEHQKEKYEIEQAVATLQEQLSRKSLVSIYEDRVTTNKELFDVIFYGGIAHSNPEKRELYKKLVESGFFSYFVFSAFSETIFFYRNCIMSIARNLAHHVVDRYGDENDKKECEDALRAREQGDNGNKGLSTVGGL